MGSKIKPALAGRNTGDVAQQDPARSCRFDLLSRQVLCHWQGMPRVRRCFEFLRLSATQAELLANPPDPDFVAVPKRLKWSNVSLLKKRATHPWKDGLMPSLLSTQICCMPALEFCQLILMSPYCIDQNCCRNGVPFRYFIGTVPTRNSLRRPVPVK